MIKGGDIVLHPAAAAVAAGARGLPSGWACWVTPCGYFLFCRNILWGCSVQTPLTTQTVNRIVILDVNVQCVILYSKSYKIFFNTLYVEQN